MHNVKQQVVKQEPNKKLMFPPLGGELITFRPKGMDFEEYKRIRANQKKLIAQRKRGWFVHISKTIKKREISALGINDYYTVLVSGTFKGAVKHLPVL